MRNSGKLENLGNSISGVGKKIMPISTAVGGLGVAEVKTAADFDSAMSQAAAVSEDALHALRDKAHEMGEKTKFSASEATETMNYMAMAGWKSKDMLSGIDGIMNLAAFRGRYDSYNTLQKLQHSATSFQVCILPCLYGRCSRK